jgi:hypothetical protein
MAELTLAKRGISYPALSLEEAVKRAEQLWNAEKKHSVPVDVVVQHWNYSSKSSGGRLVVAALLSFGLLADEGRKDERLVQLTPTALDILLNTIESKERIQALQAAIRKPKIYAELLSKWSADDLPSDQTIKTFLIRDKDFNTKMVDTFIKCFRSSIKYAKLDESPVTNTTDENAEASIEMESETSTTLPALVKEPLNVTSKIVQQPSVAIGMRQDVFALNEGNATLIWPESMSANSFEDFKDWMEIVLRKIKRTIDVS